MQKYLDITRDQYKAFMAISIDGPLHMLNLLKFKKQVSENGLTGAEQYKIYLKAAMPFIKKANAKVLYYGKPQLTLIGPEGDLEWDEILIVAYPSKTNFINMATAEGYPSELRKLALEDSRLIFCEGVN